MFVPQGFNPGQKDEPLEQYSQEACHHHFECEKRSATTRAGRAVDRLPHQQLPGVYAMAVRRTRVAKFDRSRGTDPGTRRPNECGPCLGEDSSTGEAVVRDHISRTSARRGSLDNAGSGTARRSSDSSSLLRFVEKREPRVQEESPGSSTSQNERQQHGASQQQKQPQQQQQQQ